jgi:excisionase family DNA binding protein
MSQLLRAEEVAELLSVAKTFVYELSRRGELPTVNVGCYRRYRREAIERWIAERESRPTNRPPASRGSGNRGANQ